MKIVCVGECAIDKYSNATTKIGGTSFNVARKLKELETGFDVSIVSAVGNDKNGTLIIKETKNNNINSQIDILEGKSPTQSINIQQNGDKRFISYNAGVLQNFELNPKQIKSIKGADVVINVCFKQLENIFSNVLELNPKGLVVADFMDLADYDKNLDILNKYISKIDIVFLGLNSNETELIQNLSKLSAEKDKLIVITLAEKGAIAFSKENKFKVKAENIMSVIDTTGAGDCFIAGFMCTYLKNSDIDKSLKSGSIEASKTIQKIGV